MIDKIWSRIEDFRYDLTGYGPPKGMESFSIDWDHRIVPFGYLFSILIAIGGWIYTISEWGFFFELLGWIPSILFGIIRVYSSFLFLQ